MQRSMEGRERIVGYYGDGSMMDEETQKINLLNEFVFTKDECPDDVLGNYEKFREELNFKDQLLANLYATNEFLKKELEEKNYIIRKLLEREGDKKDKGFVTGVAGSDETKNVLNNLSFNSEFMAFNDDSLDDSNSRLVYNEENDDANEEKCDNCSSSDTTTINIDNTISKKHISPTSSYIPVEQQLSDYRSTHRENFRVVRRNCASGYRLRC